MQYNNLKLIIVGVMSVALVVGLIVGMDPLVATPLLTLLVGYVVGNAKVTDREGTTAPIISTTG